MIKKNIRSLRVPQSPWEAFFSAMWPLNTWKKKLILTVIFIAVVMLCGCFSIWASLPEGKKVALIDFITAKITNRSQLAQKPVATNELAPPPKSLPLLEKDKPKAPQGGHKKEVQENTPVKQPVDIDKNRNIQKFDFEITGSTVEEKNILQRQLADLNIKSATITIVKSELDKSRNIYINVIYKDNITRSLSFNTPLDNASNLILSEITSDRRQ